MIRIATMDDVSTIRVCAIDAYQKYIALIGKKLAPMLADFEEQIAQGYVYVAEEHDGQIGGFIVFCQRDDHMFLENVAVKSSATGKGLGKSLIKFCEAEAMRIGLLSVELYTNERMSDNLSMYLHLGYKEFDRKTEDGFSRVNFD